ncbi:hypothetical protein [Oleisolibacter albus]|uniref:hypothetical protein n=1 Tax=Oleisolibacter albus TaxID=2171757 RepID=UPI0012D81982|nr:hypothetical protein [Oleisolibacter albus]
MPVGFVSYANNGTVQIDENASNLAFVQKQTVIPNQTYPVKGGLLGIIRKATVQYVGSAISTPLMFVHAPNSGFSVLRTSSQIVGAVETWSWDIVTTSSQPLECFFFDQAQATVSGGTGIEVYDAAGRLRMSSAYKPLVVRDLIYQESLPLGVFRSSIADFSGRKIAAFCQSKVVYEQSELQSPPSDPKPKLFWYAGILMTTTETTGKVYVLYERTIEGKGIVPDIYKDMNFSTNILLVDVTGY